MRKRHCLPREQLAPFEVEAPKDGRRLDSKSIFQNNDPLEIEIGFGKGAMLLAMAERRAHHNFLGIEWDRGLQLYVASRLARRGGLRNVRVAYGDANVWLRDALLPSRAYAIHVYFPDPWWKRRHHKRRLFTPAFVQLCWNTLEHQGLLAMATDVEEYFAIMEQSLRCVPGFVPVHDINTTIPIQTSFSNKAIKANRPIWKAIYQKS